MPEGGNPSGGVGALVVGLDSILASSSRGHVSSPSVTWVSKNVSAVSPSGAADLYEIILNRHRVSNFVITNNRAAEEWLSFFDDPILGNSALDRMANASYQIVIKGSNYRERLSPHRKLMGDKKVIDQPTVT